MGAHSIRQALAAQFPPKASVDMPIKGVEAAEVQKLQATDAQVRTVLVERAAQMRNIVNFQSLVTALSTGTISQSISLAVLKLQNLPFTVQIRLFLYHTDVLVAA